MPSALAVTASILLLVPCGAPPSAMIQQVSAPVQAANTQNLPHQPLLEDGTPVKLRIAQTVSSADAHVNDKVEFEVLEEVRISDVLVIPKGGLAWGTVTEAEPKRRMARGGKLEIVMDSVRLADGERAALRATKEGKGGGHTGAMTAGIVATGLIFWPAAPFFLFMHGKDITIPKGTEVPTFVNGNFALDFSKFQPTSATPVAAPLSSTPVLSSAGVTINSTPTGAEISVDENYVGNAPSTITLSPGKHRISVHKQGFETWEREINVSGGTVNITAELAVVTASSNTPQPVKKNDVAPPAPPPVRSQPRTESSPPLASEISTGWIGVTVKDESGKILISSVERQSPAERAELQVGDSIQLLNGETVKSARDFERAIRRATPGSQVRIGYTRTFWMVTATVSVGKR